MTTTQGQNDSKELLIKEPELPVASQFSIASRIGYLVKGPALSSEGFMFDQQQLVKAMRRPL